MSRYVFLIVFAFPAPAAPDMLRLMKAAEHAGIDMLAG